jgi:hypothetical protein
MGFCEIKLKFRKKLNYSVTGEYFREIDFKMAYYRNKRKLMKQKI